MDTPSYWLPSKANGSDDNAALSQIDCVCIGSGRFLRAVLVPILVQAGFHPAMVQPRGRSFVEFMNQETISENGSYPVDTVLRSGEIQTDEIRCFGAFSWGKSADKAAFYDRLALMQPPRIVGLGVTEAGLASTETQVMKDLYDFFQACCRSIESNTWTLDRKLCVIDMDNVPNNGQVVHRHMMTLARDDGGMQSFFSNHVSFHSTMVDRITSQRPDSNGMIPRCEPIPQKALVVLDELDNLPSAFRSARNNLKKLGLAVHTQQRELEADIAMKLRVANGTHTAIAHLLALLKKPMTDCLSATEGPEGKEAALLLEYLDQLFQHQIRAAGVSPGLVAPDSQEIQAVYDDWRNRLTHPHFGLSSFFITQNGAQKGGIRLGPTVRDLTLNRNESVSVATAFAFAALLRWLTPAATRAAASQNGEEIGKFMGWLQGSFPSVHAITSKETREYADGLRHDFQHGWYEFCCNCRVLDGETERLLSEWLGSLVASDVPNQAVDAFVPVLRAYLVAPEGGNMAELADHDPFDSFVRAIAILYARMVSGEDFLGILREMKEGKGRFCDGMATMCSALGGDESNFPSSIR